MAKLIEHLADEFGLEIAEMVIETITNTLIAKQLKQKVSYKGGIPIPNELHELAEETLERIAGSLSTYNHTVP